MSPAPKLPMTAPAMAPGEKILSPPVEEGQEESRVDKVSVVVAGALQLALFVTSALVLAGMDFEDVAAADEVEE